jgi:hypothetical protein
VWVSAQAAWPTGTPPAHAPAQARAQPAQADQPHKTKQHTGVENTRVLDPDSVTLRIRIRIGNPDSGSGSRGKKIKKFQWKNTLFIYFKKLLPLKRNKIPLTTRTF